MKQMSKQALEGLKVVEIGNILAGPWCGTMLADFGAEVIKVEPPKGGDLMRNMGRIKDLWFCVEGRNKKNITLDLKTEKGKEILWELIKDADVLIENFRPGVFAKLGFTWEKLHAFNERLVYVVSSGYGRSGPEAHKPGFDRIGLARGGFLEITGEPDRAPIKPGISVADFYTAMFACIGTMFAIYNRDVVGTGKGQMVDCCLTESMLRLQESIIAEYSYDKTIRRRMGNAAIVTIPSGHFQTKDGKWITLSITGDKLYNTWAKAVGREDLIPIVGEERKARREEINAIAEKWVNERNAKEVMEIFGDEIPASIVYDVSDIFNDPQFAARGALVEVPTEKFGTLTMQNVTPRMMETPGKINWAGAPLGFFNNEVLKEKLGYTDEEIKKLHEEGVI